MTQLAPQTEQWKSFEENGRSFYRFPVTLENDRQVSYTIAQDLAEQYRIHGVLARGGGGVILKATDRLTSSEVFIKGIADYDMQRENLEEPLEEVVESIRRSRHHLQTERRILVQLNNEGCSAVPKVVNYVYDVNHSLTDLRQTNDGNEWSFDDQNIYRSEPYLVMNPVPGVPLNRLMEDFFENGMKWNVAVGIIDQIAEVIQVLQKPIQLEEEIEWKLIYQDLKPGNIVVDEYGHATLLDFGGCQLLINDTLVLGGSHSPGYCPPECSVNSDPITATADTYGIGSTLFHMVSGINPRNLVPGNLKKDEPKSVRFTLDLLKNYCPTESIPFFLKCLAWDAEERFQTIEELREQLAAYS